MHTKFDRRVFFFLFVLVFGAVAAYGSARSQDNVWTRLDRSQLRQPGIDAASLPAQYEVFGLNRMAVQAILAAAPPEFTGGRQVILTLPMPDGTFERFAIEHSPIVEAGLLQKFPELGATYKGQGLDDGTATVRLDLLPSGFHAIVLSARGTVLIDPYAAGDDSYMVYNKSSATRQGTWECLVEDIGASPFTEALRPTGFNVEAVLRGAGSNDVTSGSQLRQYRLALAGNFEYCAAASVGGNTIANCTAAMVLVMNRVNGVYERDVAIRMNLIANNDLIVYAANNMTCPVPAGGQACTASNDPYSNNTQALGQNQTNLDLVIGTANYDIGHVFTTGSGGVATLNSPCNATSKARGTTGLPNPTGDPFAIDYVAHEMGHQYGANHTFNDTTCGSAPAHARMEPGSAITIMGYAGPCEQQYRYVPRPQPRRDRSV